MLAKLSVKRPFTVLVAVILVVILGVMAFTRMTPDLLPNIDLPYVIIATSFAGASPEEVEETVTKPVEQSVATLDHIKTIQSVSSENFSLVILQFADKANMDATTMNIREKLSLISGDWNDYVGTPIILKINPNIIPLSAVALHFEGMSTIELSTFFKETLSTRMEGIEGVASVTASGLIFEQVNVVLQQDKMDAVNARIRAAIDGEFAEGEQELADAQAELDDGVSALEDAQKKIDAGRSGLRSASGEASTQFAQARAQLDAAEKQLNSLLSMLGGASSAGSALDQAIAGLENQLTQMNPSDPSLPGLQQQLGEAQGQRAALYGTIAAATGMSVTDQASLEAAVAAATQKANDELAKLPALRAELDKQEDDARKQINNAYGQLNKGQTQLDEGKTELEDAQAQLDDANETLDETKKNAYDASDLNNLLTLSTVGGILGAQNFSMPAGYVVDGGNAQWLVYVGDQIHTLEELRELILFDLGLEGLDPIYLSDVADIFMSDNTSTTYARLNGDDAVLLTFNKQSGYATATVSDNIQEEFRQLSEEFPGLSFSALMEQGDYIDIVISSVLNNIWVGAVLAIIILLIFLRNIKPTLVVACSIPISLTFAVVLMYFSGVTLNVISLAGLAVGVGMLVDNSIVVIENVYRLRQEHQFNSIKAAVVGTRQMAGAITASTLTTVCVFLPIVFIQGLTRQLFADMALTITYSLMASLIVALTLVPALSSGLLRNMRQPKREPKQRLQKAYEKSLNFTLKHKALSLIVALVLLGVSAFATITRGFIYLPDMDSPQMMVNLSMPEDASYEETVATTDEAVERLRALPEVDTVGAMFSSGLASVIGLGTASQANTTETMIYLVLHEPPSFMGFVSKANRQRSSIDLGIAIEDLLKDLPCEASVTGTGNMADYMSMMGSSGVEIILYADDLETLLTSAQTVGAELAKVEGVASVNNGVEDTTPALRVSVDKYKAGLEGLTVAQVYQNIAVALTEEATVTTIQDTKSDIVIRVREDQLGLDDIRNRVLTVQNKDGSYKKVRLSDIASFSESETLRSISRSEQRRYIAVSAALEPGYNVTLVTSDAMRALEGLSLPAGVEMEFSGENETIMTAMEDLMLMLLLGIAIVYLIMVAQFQSLLSPLIVLVTVPLAFTGGLLALLIAGFEISIVAMIGFIMLVGIIVNNGIVLIDTMNQLRMEGMERREAIQEACRTRLRPVLMTALTTILGLVPLAIGSGMGAGLVQPVAIVSIGGLTYATFMTLFIVPILYDVLVKRSPRKVSKEDLEAIEE